MKNWWPLRGDEGGVEARISAEEILGHALTPISVCTVILLGVWLSLRAPGAMASTLAAKHLVGQ